jgi:AraC-like DNA-binding protein
MQKAEDIERYFKDVARPVVVLRNDYPDGHFIPPHHHRRCQLLHGFSGVVMVTTPQGACVMPPQRGMWIPAGIQHEVRTLGEVRMRSLYFEPDATAGMPKDCRVLGITAFMRSLIAEASDVPAEYDPDSRAGALMTLIQHEMQRLPILPLALPLPASHGLTERCRAFLHHPDPHATIDEWTQVLGMSRRSFTRLFRRETGLSFVEWRQQACIVAALPRLAAREPITTIAMDLGYDNPAAFTAMFKRMLGSSPRAYLGERAIHT